MSLVARHLEANGIPTVIYACARDIVEHCGVARLVSTDFPLGNPCGRPYDAAMQRQIVAAGLDLLETATKPGTTVQTPFTWSKDESWKEKAFTDERPFLGPEETQHWLEGKERYRELRKAGKV